MIRKFICVALVFLGGMMILCAAGASDAGTMELSRAWWQSVGGMLCIGIAFVWEIRAEKSAHRAGRHDGRKKKNNINYIVPRNNYCVKRSDRK